MDRDMCTQQTISPNLNTNSAGNIAFPSRTRSRPRKKRHDSAGIESQPSRAPDPARSQPKSPTPGLNCFGRSRGGREGLTTRDSWWDMGTPAASNLSRRQEDGDRLVGGDPDRVLGRRRQAALGLPRVLGVSHFM